MPRHLTVVYTIEDESSFSEEQDRIMTSLREFDPASPPGWGVSAVSSDNEMLRLERIEQAVASSDGVDDIVDNISDLLSAEKLS